MFVPPSPSQPGDTPGSIRRPTSLSGKGKVPAKGKGESGGEGGSAGRMVDKRRRVETAGTAADSEGGSSSSSSGSSGGRLLAAVVADQEKPTPISLSEAKQVLDGDGDDWRPKVAALRQLQDQLAAAEGSLDAEDARDVVNFMESLAAACRALKNTKPEIAGAARVTQLVCAVISGLAKVVGTGFCAPAAAIIPDLLPFLSTPREAVQEAVATSVEDMLAECPSPSVLRAATVSLAGSKRAYLRRKGSGFLCVAIQRWPKDALRTTLSPIMGQMRKALFDADATVRREGRHTFGIFIRLWPAEGGGMYHALDRANQRAVLQEQPHVSNFIGGSSNASIAVAGSAAAPSTTAALKPASSVSETSSSAPAVVVADKSTATIAAAAAASAATRIAMATGGGGGGGQRPAGVTQAQHRSLMALKVERERRLKDQQRLAAAGVTKGSSSSTSSTGGRVAGGGGNRLTSKAVAITMGGNGGGNGGGISLSSIPAVMSAPSSPTTAGAAGVNPFGFRSPTAGGASRLPAAPSSSCSDGLRRAARLALRKNDLMSPTLKRLLQDPAQLRTAGSVAGWFGREEDHGVSSPGSEESGLDTEGDVTGGVGARMTPSELRGSTSGASPLGGGGGGSSSVRSDSYLSSCSSGEEEDSDSGGEENGEGGGSTTRGRNHLPTRILFGLERDADGDNGDDVAEPPPPQSPKQQRISAIARAAASASAARHAALEMKPPPPRPPAPAPISTLPETADTTATTAEHPKLADLGCPSPRGSVVCTPTRGILADRSGNKGLAAAASSSTAKRRVRFELEERAREAASLNSPCRSSSSPAPGWWSRASAADSEEEEAQRGEWGRRSVRPRGPVVLSALTVAVSVGAVAFLGGGRGVGVGAGHRGIARRHAGCYSSSSSYWSSVCLPWAVEPEPEVCPNVSRSDGAARVVVAEQGEVLEDASATEQAAGVSADEGKVAEEAPVSVVYDVVVEHAAAGAVQDGGEGEGVANDPQGAPADSTVSADLDHERQQPPAELHHHDHHHHHHHEAETGSSIGHTGEGASVSAAAFQPKEPSPSSPSAAASGSVWGWFEVGAATLSAAMLLATVVWRSRGAGDDGDGWGGVDGDGDGGGDGPSTPPAGGGGGGDGGEGQELGRYETMEMIKKADTPATIRSVRRSRRIGSAQKPAPPGILVVDLGAAALNVSNMNMG